MVTRFLIHAREKVEYGGHYGEEQGTTCMLHIQDHPMGDWVKFEDYEKLLERFDLLETMFLEANDPLL